VRQPAQEVALAAVNEPDQMLPLRIANRGSPDGDVEREAEVATLERLNCLGEVARHCGELSRADRVGQCKAEAMPS